MEIVAGWIRIGMSHPIGFTEFWLEPALQECVFDGNCLSLCPLEKMSEARGSGRRPELTCTLFHGVNKTWMRAGIRGCRQPALRITESISASS